MTQVAPNPGPTPTSVAGTSVTVTHISSKESQKEVVEEEEKVEAVQFVSTFTAVLEKRTWPRFGIGYRVSNKTLELIITGIVRDSAAEAWNLMCKIPDAICTGDTILSVNGERLVRGMIDELKTSSQVELLILKTGPRWHLENVVRSGSPAEKSRSSPSQRSRSSKNLKNQFTADLQTNMSGATVMTAHTVSNTPEEPLRCTHLPLLTLAIFGPNVLAVILFSDMGIGLQVYTTLAKEDHNMMGNGLVALGSAIFVILVMLDWYKWHSKCKKALSILVSIYAICAGAIFKTRFYPFAPLVITIFHIPVFYGVARTRSVKGVKRRQFYIAVTVSAVLCGLITFAAWLVWINASSWDGTNQWNDETKARLVADSEEMYDDTQITVAGRRRSLNYWWDCDPDHSHDVDYIAIERFRYFEGAYLMSNNTLSSDDKERRGLACARVKTIWFLAWATPLICVGIDFVIAVFCLLNGVLLNVQDVSKMEKIVKQFILMIAFLVFTMYVSTSVAGASMRLTGVILAFCVSGLVALFIWLYLEVGRRAITSTVRSSKLMQSIIALATSDWVRATVLIGLNVLVPIALIINILNQKVRKLRGHASPWESRFTAEMYWVIDACRNWSWARILIKANWLVILYWTFSVGVAKFTYVFLSWLNEVLLEINFGMVLVVFFVIGFTMFMLPPVPGIPVYICSGIVLSARARDIDAVGGFWGGTAIAVIESLVLKICAVCGQYYIGYYLGKMVKVQQLIGVDKIPTRAIEKILNVRGMNLPKVSVLVGGPDWPTSVLCGILKLQLFQCCLGTLPVIFVSSPCVIAGAFMANPGASGKQDEGVGTAASSKEEEMWDTFSTTMLAVSFMVQLAGMVVALYFIQEVVYTDEEQLAQPREEHRAVAELTRREAEYVKTYDNTLRWQSLERKRKYHIFLSTSMMVVSAFMFVMMDEACFRQFQVSNHIGDPYDLDGLNGNAFNIVLPAGWVATSLFFLACVLHFWFLHWARKATAKQMAELL